MIYAQFKGGQKMHLVYEAGEGHDEVIRKGYLSWPLCGRKGDQGYRMTCNLPLANACKNCNRVYAARHGRN